jgi:hypothetical protein
MRRQHAGTHDDARNRQGRDAAAGRRQAALYIDFLENAPWNVRPLTDEPLFGGVGMVLMRAAVTLSVDEGFHGRVGLHSLRQAEEFYPEWLLRMAEKEANGIVSVGGFMCGLGESDSDVSAAATDRAALAQLVEWQRRKLRLSVEQLATQADCRDRGKPSHRKGRRDQRTANCFQPVQCAEAAYGKTDAIGWAGFTARPSRGTSRGTIRGSVRPH